MNLSRNKTNSCYLPTATDKGISEPKQNQHTKHFHTVLRIHDILVWIRIRGSMHLTNGSGSGQSFSAYYFLKILLHHFSKVKSQKEDKTVEIMVLLTILLWLMDPDPDPEGQKTRGSGSGSATLHIRETTFTYQNCGDCYTISTLAQNDK